MDVLNQAKQAAASQYNTASAQGAQMATAARQQASAMGQQAAAMGQQAAQQQAPALSANSGARWVVPQRMMPALNNVPDPSKMTPGSVFNTATVHAMDPFAAYNKWLFKVLIGILIGSLIIMLFLWSSTCKSGFTPQLIEDPTFHTKEVRNIAHGEFPLYRGPTRNSVEQIGQGEPSTHWEQDVYMASRSVPVGSQRTPTINAKATQFATDVDFS